jgi:hypothetical protein
MHNCLCVRAVLVYGKVGVLGMVPIVCWWMTAWL